MQGEREPWSLSVSRRVGIDPAVFSAKTEDGRVAQAVSLILREDKRSRDEIAADISVLAGERISRAMLDAYSSKARREHPIPTHRLFALIALTGRWDVLDRLIAPYGIRLAAAADVELIDLGDAMKKRHLLDQYILQALNAEGAQ